MKLIKEYMNFERGVDPKHAMGIGQIKKIRKWLDNYKITDYTINKDLSIDVNGHVDFRSSAFDMNPFSNFPDFIQFNNVFGFFTIVNKGFTTLKGCPKYVEFQFCCNRNKLTSLEYCPKEVGDFVCYGNPVLFTVEEIRTRCKINRSIEIIQDVEIK